LNRQVAADRTVIVPVHWRLWLTRWLALGCATAVATTTAGIRIAMTVRMVVNMTVGRLCSAGAGVASAGVCATMRMPVMKLLVRNMQHDTVAGVQRCEQKGDVFHIAVHWAIPLPELILVAILMQDRIHVNWFARL